MSDENPSFLERKPLLEHLDDLLKHARRIAIWVMIGAAVGYYFSNDLVHVLTQPLIQRLPPGSKLVFTAPFEKIWAYLHVALISGLFLVCPMIGWEVAAFVGPAMKAREKRRVWLLLISFCIAFVAGLALGYQVVLPLVLKTLLSFGSATEIPMFTLSKYINTTLGILLLCAVFMEFPVIMTHLSYWGWVSARKWHETRRYAVVVNALIAAFLAPPDVLSMILMLVPLQVLYECGILGAYMAQWLSYERSEKLA